MGILAWDIIKFLKQYGEPQITVGSMQDSYEFFYDIINAGQTALVYDENNNLASAALYFKVRELSEVRWKRGTFLRMRKYRHGHIVYVHTVVIRPDYRKKNAIWRIAKIIRDRELLCDTVAFTFNKNEKWTYNIERRRTSMRDNCGIIALDALLKSMNGTMTRISLDTLSKICRDNGRLMYPVKIPKAKLAGLVFPYIMQTNNHYEVIEDETALDGLEVPEEVYLLHPKLDASIIPHVIDEEEAKEVKGAGGGGGLQGLISKPGRLLPMAVSAAAPMLGIGPTMGNILGTGVGALQGATSGLWGGSPLTGAAAGFGQSLLGRGIGSGISNWMNPAPNTTFNQGFMSGIGQAMPYKNAINSALGTQFYTPSDSWGVNALNPSGGAIPGVSTFNTPTSNTPLTDAFKANQNAAFNPFTGVGGNFGGGGGGGGDGGGGNGGSSISSLLNGIPQSSFSYSPKSSGQDNATQPGLVRQLLPSAALMMLGQAIPQPKYNVPNAADVYTELVNSGKIPTTAGPLGVAAQQATLNNINSPDSILHAEIQPYKDAIISDLTRREQMEIAQTKSNFAANGLSGGSDEQRAIQDVQAKYRDYQTQTLGAIDQDLYNQKVNIYLSSIADAYKMDQANLQTIAGLTGMGIQQAAEKYALKAKDVSDFRNAINQLAISASPGASQATATNLLRSMFSSAAK